LGPTLDPNWNDIEINEISSLNADDPGRWLLTGASSVPNTYWQGLTSDPAQENVFFAGTFEGLWRTTPQPPARSTPTLATSGPTPTST